MGFRRKMESPKNGRMMKLKRSILQEIAGVNNLILPTEEQLHYPEKVLQFGTGVLLRGLPDQYISEANRAGKFCGRVVVVKSTQNGSTDDFAEQDGLYTVCVKGIDNGHLVDKAYVNASISRVLSATEDWTSILAFAKSEELSVVTSIQPRLALSIPKKIYWMLFHLHSLESFWQFSMQGISISMVMLPKDWSLSLQN